MVIECFVHTGKQKGFSRRKKMHVPSKLTKIPSGSWMSSDGNVCAVHFECAYAEAGDLTVPVAQLAIGLIYMRHGQLFVMSILLVLGLV